MSKKKENPYEIEQAVLELDSEKLESVSEKELKKLLDSTKTAYNKKRKERLEIQKQFIQLYTNSRKELVKFYKDVKDGAIPPNTAIENFKDYVAEDNWKIAE